MWACEIFLHGNNVCEFGDSCSSPFEVFAFQVYYVEELFLRLKASWTPHDSDFTFRVCCWRICNNQKLQVQVLSIRICIILLATGLKHICAIVHLCVKTVFCLQIKCGVHVDARPL